MFTEEEVMSLIEEAFESGYDSALDEILDESEEVDTEYPELFSYNENLTDSQKKNIRTSIAASKYKSPEERRDDIRYRVANAARETNRNIRQNLIKAKDKTDYDTGTYGAYDGLIKEKENAEERMQRAFYRHMNKINKREENNKKKELRKSLINDMIHK